jgi:hypothetical protein
VLLWKVAVGGWDLLGVVALGEARNPEAIGKDLEDVG